MTTRKLAEPAELQYLNQRFKRIITDNTLNNYLHDSINTSLAADEFNSLPQKNNLPNLIDFNTWITKNISSTGLR